MLRPTRLPSELTMEQHPGADLLEAKDWHYVRERFSLSGRELHVARLVVEGKRRDEIALELGCAAASVRTYIDRIFRKLEVEDRLAMALQIVRVLKSAKLSFVTDLNLTCSRPFELHAF